MNCAILEWVKWAPLMRLYPMLMCGLAVCVWLSVLRCRNALSEPTAVASGAVKARQSRNRRSNVHDANPKVEDALQRLQRSVSYFLLMWCSFAARTPRDAASLKNALQFQLISVYQRLNGSTISLSLLSALPNGQSYIPSNWFQGIRDNLVKNSTLPDDGLLLSIPCSRSVTELLYVVVKRTTSLPSFDTRFADYGYNRQEWIQHLRYSGYEFKVLQDGFCVEIQHPYSPFYNHFESSVEGQTNGTTKYPSEELFLRFVSELKNRSVRVLYTDCALWSCLLWSVLLIWFALKEQSLFQRIWNREWVLWKEFKWFYLFFRIIRLE